MAAYFAYGSNMLPARLGARCASARVIGVAWAPGWRLRFWKRGMDGSGKATLLAGPGAVPGVIFEVAAPDWAALDRAEGPDYDRQMLATSRGAALAYIAPAPDPAMVPFDWYRDVVVAGARFHALPPDHIAALAATPARPDPVAGRPGRLAALAAMAL